MQEFLAKLLSGDVIGYVLAALLAVNALLSAAGAVFAAIGKSESVPSWVAKVSSMVAKLIDIISANRKH